MELKEKLINEGIIKIKKDHEIPYILKSGKTSKIFIDIKEASLNPSLLKAIVGSMDEAFIMWFDCFGSVAIGGIPIGTALSIRFDIPQIIVRSEKHDRGVGSKIIGNCRGKKILLIEDVSTTGASILDAVNDIRSGGGMCNSCIVIVDREEGSKELCKDNGILLKPLLTLSELI